MRLIKLQELSAPDLPELHPEILLEIPHIFFSMFLLKTLLGFLSNYSRNLLGISRGIFSKTPGLFLDFSEISRGILLENFSCECVISFNFFYEVSLRTPPTLFIKYFQQSICEFSQKSSWNFLQSSSQNLSSNSSCDFLQGSFQNFFRNFHRVPPQIWFTLSGTWNLSGNTCSIFCKSTNIFLEIS